MRSTRPNLSSGDYWTNYDIGVSIRRATRCFLAFALCGLPAIALGQESRSRLVGHIQPLQEELLDKPIPLKNCPIDVIEWRGTPNRPGTAPSAKAIRVLEDTCEQATKGFASFVAEELSTPAGVLAPIDGRYSLCLLPFEGSDYRSLNDSDFRFFDRTKERREDGSVYGILGYFAMRPGIIFLRNDVLLPGGEENPRTVTIFAHEVFHLMSYSSGLFNSYGPELSFIEKVSIDERNARKFTMSIGLGE